LDGLNSVVLEIISAFQTRLDLIMVGRMLGSSLLGVYSLAYRIPEIVIAQFCTAVATVIFPIYTTIQNDSRLLKESFLRTVQYLTLITVPLGLGLAVLSKPIVIVLYTEKWLEMVPAMQAIAVFEVLLAILYGAGIVYKAKGYLKMMSVLSLAEIILLAPAYYFGIVYYKTLAAVAWLQALVTFVFVIVELVLAIKIIEVPVLAVIQAIVPACLVGAVMAGVIYLVQLQLAGVPAFLQLIIGIGLGAVIYVGGIFLFQRKVVLDGINSFKFALAKG
jgi:O-antigen/teichoic acid export membrane protein